MWVYIGMAASLLLSLVAFVTGVLPVGVALLVVLIVLLVIQLRSPNPSARRAERNEHRDPTEPLGPAHEGQAHMTPDKL